MPGILEAYGVAARSVERYRAGGIGAVGIAHVRAGFTSLDAKAAASIQFKEASLAPWLGNRREVDRAVGDNAAEPAARARVGDEHVVDAEFAESGDARDVAVGPVAHKRRLVKVVRRGDFPGLKALVVEHPFDVVTDCRDQGVRRDIGASPFSR